MNCDGTSEALNIRCSIQRILGRASLTTTEPHLHAASDYLGRIVAWLEHQWVGDGRVDGSPPTMRHGSVVGRRVACWQTRTGENDGRAHRACPLRFRARGSGWARLRWVLVEIRGCWQGLCDPCRRCGWAISSGRGLTFAMGPLCWIQFRAMNASARLGLC